MLRLFNGYPSSLCSSQCEQTLHHRYHQKDTQIFFMLWMVFFCASWQGKKIFCSVLYEFYVLLPQLGRELEIWGRATGKEQIPAGWIIPVKWQRSVCLMKQLFTNDTESFCPLLCYFSEGPLNPLWQNIFFWNIHWFLACRKGKVIWSSSVQPPTYYRPLYLLCLFFWLEYNVNLARVHLLQVDSCPGNCISVSCIFVLFFPLL